MKLSLIKGFVIILSITSFVFAQESPLIDFQAKMVGCSGEPMGRYPLVFRLYCDSTGPGNPLWTELHPDVLFTDGLFQVELGSITPLNQQILGEEPLYLEIQMEEEVFLPRMRFNTVPRAAFAQGLKGDIMTEPGFFLFRSSRGDSAITFRSNGSTNSFSISWLDSTEGHAVEISSGVDAPGSIKMFNPQPEPPHDPILEINTGFGGEASIYMFNPQPEPPHDRMLEMSTIPGNSATFKMFNPQPEPPHDPVLEMNTGIGGQGSFKMFNPQPEPPNDPMVEISTTPGSNASFKMFNPQPEPPHDPVLEMSTGIGGQGSFKMFNPQPEPPHDPMVEISTTPGSNASFKMFNPQPEPPHDPFLEMNTGLHGVNFRLSSPQLGRQVGNAIAMVTSDSGGTMLFYDEDGDHVWMNMDPDGDDGNLRLFNPNGGTTVKISSTGRIGIGTESPTTALDVNGTAKMTGFKMLTGATNGYVLTSDNTGMGSWQPAVAGSDGDWTIVGMGVNMYSAVPGNVGIGVTNPIRKLHISDVMRLQPRISYPSSPGEGDICIVDATGGGNHIYCYLRGGWRQLD